MASDLVGAIDQGTSSSRFLVFTRESLILGGDPICSSSVELPVSYPHPSWAETDANLIYETVVQCIEEADLQLKSLGLDIKSLKCVGITNQRETTLLWNRETCAPYGPAIGWQDTRTRHLIEEFKKKERDEEVLKNLLDGKPVQYKTGLVLSEYSCCSKLVWMLRNNEQLKADLSDSNKGHSVCFGTVDTWLVWKLTGGREHSTDVTNASRTNLMSLHSLNWDESLLSFFSIPASILPKIKSNAELFGTVTSLPLLNGIPITACMGDQHAALVGHHCFEVGQSKNTYGTGLFLLSNIGTQIAFSQKGVLTTVGYQMGPEKPPSYAMEGAIATGGQAIKWLRDIELIENTAQVESVAAQVQDTDGVFFVPAFSGLFTPYWDSTARGTVCGISFGTTKHHIARAVLESLCYQTRDVLDTIQRECNLTLKELKVDGGATRNNLLLQIQSDILNLPVCRPENVEQTAYGAALAAAIGAKLISGIEEIQVSTRMNVFKPKIEPEKRAAMYKMWLKAVEKSQNWV